MKRIYSDIRVSIFFKSNANPKYICYCNKVREEDIEEAILKKSAKDMKGIIKITGAMRNTE
ncbi:MAG: (2Fe-2S)-binding protein [Andreesenia angusta]|nr:(2Fe-2S)-binding protein [Andreesenia angusta]